MAEWIPDNLEGSDVVRAVVARRLAAELDAPDLPAHALARITGALLNVVSSLDKREVIELGQAPTRQQLGALLDALNNAKE